MDCPTYLDNWLDDLLELWEVAAPLPLRTRAELFCGPLPLLPFHYGEYKEWEWGVAVLENTPFVLFIQRRLSNGEPDFGNPFFIKLTPQIETDFWPLSIEPQAQAEPWIAAINETLNRTGREKNSADLQGASQTSLAFWNNPIDDETWNDFSPRDILLNDAGFRERFE